MRTSYQLLLPAALVLVIACNHETPPGEAGKPDTVAAPMADTPVPVAADTLAELLPVAETDRAFDSMMNLEVTLPPILDDKAYDTATVNSFTRLADITRGEMKLLASADLLQRNISDIICKNNVDYGDVLFLMDVTGSMSDDIAEVKEGMAQIIAQLKDKRGVRLAIATYGDMQCDPGDWFRFRNFETDYYAAQVYVDSLSVSSGCDLPESVYEAFIESAKQRFWQSRTKRVVLIVGDARGKSKAEGGLYDIEDMLAKASESRIKVNFFPLIVTPYSEKYRSGDDAPQPATATALIDRLYPNPTNGDIFIKLKQEGRYHITVHTMTGMMVEDRNVDDDLWMIDMRIHAEGLYVVRVTDANNQYDVAKFIVRR